MAGRKLNNLPQVSRKQKWGARWGHAYLRPRPQGLERCSRGNRATHKVPDEYGRQIDKFSAYYSKITDLPRLSVCLSLCPSVMYTVQAHNSNAKCHKKTKIGVAVTQGTSNQRVDV